MENINSVTNLLKNVPKEILSKINFSTNTTNEYGTNLEVIVLFGEGEEAVQTLVSGLGGKFENLGYGYGIVTIAFDKLIDLARSKDIQYIELPKSLYFTDSESNKAACVDRARSEFSLDGEGIVIGFIDTGIDYTHPAFLNDDGTTRIEYIYDLSLNGQVYNKSQINNALKSNDPYSVVPSYDSIEHGTHVVGIACAGGKINSRYYGVAPKSSIMMVKSGRGLFSLSTNILRGISFLITKSRELTMPLVINISLSTNDGAHNGTSLLEQYIGVIAKSERVTIAIAAGNEGNAAHHVSGKLESSNVVKFEVAEDETAVIINLYKSVLPSVSLEFIAPTGGSTGGISIEETFIEGVISGNKYQVYNTGPKPFDISGEIGISLISNGNYIIPGVWTIILRTTNEYEGIYDMWLPISEGLNKKTKFLEPVETGTLGIPATVPDVISVGSYNYVTKNISAFSGRGRKNSLYFFEKPDIVAPGEGIFAPVPDSSFDTKTGTSMATPHVSGISALMMEWGIIKGNDPYLYGDRLKYYLVKGARKERADITYPDTSWGYGEVCLYDSLKIVQDILGIVTGTAPNYRQEKNEFNSIGEYRNKLFLSDERVGFLVEFSTEDIIFELNKFENISVVTVSQSYAIVFAPLKDRDIISRYAKNIIEDELTAIYTLNAISPIEDTKVLGYHKNEYLTLDGRDVLIALIDSGIDYLNEEFMYEDDTTRIIKIWDQTIEDNEEVQGLRLGKEFSRDEINKAIKLKKSGGDPYSIVSSKDEVGHGTMVASISAARGRDSRVEGVANNSELLVVKLKPEGTDKLKLSGITKPNVIGYGIANIMVAIRYISKISSELKKPVVIIFAMGSNLGPHDGSDIIPINFDNFIAQAGSAVVTGTGNEGDTDTHTEGSIKNDGEESQIELMVGEKQKTLNIQIWIDKPDVMSISIVSPSGEIIERIPARDEKIEEFKFIYEQTLMSVEYFLSNKSSGDENININLVNLKPGIWRFILHGDYIINGKYSAWIPQRYLLDEDTKFLSPSPNVTLMNPSDGKKLISVAYYNQDNNIVLAKSGRGFTRDGRIKPDVAAAGINALVKDSSGNIKSVSGSSVATALVGGICALILQWAIVDKNKPLIYIQEITSYIIRGARMRKGDNYPNSEWGYGVIDFEGIIKSLRGEYREENLYYSEFKIGEIFIRKPSEFIDIEVKEEDIFR